MTYYKSGDSVPYKKKKFVPTKSRKTKSQKKNRRRK